MSKTHDADVIVVGAGAAGLMAARVLSQKNLNVLVLEARERIGGRVHTIYEKGFDQPVELGAEFIHGHLPLTMGLLNEAGVGYYKVKGKMVSFRGKPHKEKDFIEEPGLLEKKLKELKTDVTVEEFLKNNLAGEQFEEVRNSVKGFVEGYDSADITRASTFALRDEWLGGDEDQYRIEGGYTKLINYLAEQCKFNGCSINTSAVVKEIRWKENKVEIKTAVRDIYNAKKVIITLPPGLLIAPEDSKGAIHFIPAIPTHIKAAQALGYGSVLKVHVQFKDQFWSDSAVKDRTGVNTSGVGFIFSDQQIPTWWTQYPVENALLTGWMGGPSAAQLKLSDDSGIYKIAIDSLSSIFKLSEKELLSKIIAWKVSNWTSDPFTLGSYAYNVFGDHEHRALLKTPIENTIWFAGEALYEGPNIGTVEAALASGAATADIIGISEDK